MTKLQERALTELSEKYVLRPDHLPIDLRSLFKGRPVVAEIGFGNGAATIEIASNHPDIGYLGIEVFRAGVGNLLHQIHANGLTNVAVIVADAVEVFRTCIPPESLRGLHLFFPDPWPKKRHHKRRIIQSHTTGLFASRIEKGGYLYVTTDWTEYAEWIRETLTAEPLLRNAANGFSPRAAWRPETRFEQKALASGRKVLELYFNRR